MQLISRDQGCTIANAHAYLEHCAYENCETKRESTDVILSQQRV
ncbi:MAG: hypothetical protein AAGH64_10025 [Planctomycetota bacterium]